MCGGRQWEEHVLKAQWLKIEIQLKTIKKDSR